ARCRRSCGGGRFSCRRAAPKTSSAPSGAAARVSGGAWGHLLSLGRSQDKKRPLGGQRPASAAERGGICCRRAAPRQKASPRGIGQTHSGLAEGSFLLPGLAEL